MAEIIARRERLLVDLNHAIRDMDAELVKKIRWELYVLGVG